MKRSRPTLLALLTALALVLLAAAPAAPAGAASGAGVRVGAAPVLPAGAQSLGAAPAEQQLQLYVALEPRDPAALERFATEVSTPGSPLYGEYLSVPAFGRRFGATDAQVATVRSALGALGLEVGAAAANNLSLPVTATVGEAEAAFGVSIDRVQTASGRVAFANDRPPALAAAAAPYVQGVIGLGDLARSHRHDAGDSAASPAGAPVQSAAAPFASPFSGIGPQPCKEALDQQEATGGYTTDQVAMAYGLDPLYVGGNFGAGQTVGLLEMEPFGQADIDAYQGCFGTDVEVSAVDVHGGPGPYKPGDDGEAALDIEQVAGLAPGARIVVYQAPNPDEAEILSAWVLQNVAKAMSSSWGICEEQTEASSVAAIDTLLQEAAVQGQSFFVAAGDWGSSDCYEERKGEEANNFLAVDFPGSDPWATDVGGTRMEGQVATTPTEYLWDDAPKWGAGGSGISKDFPMPAYQQGAAASLGVLGPLSSGAPCGSAGYCRQVPDVSAEASVADNKTGYVIHAEEHWETNGGTSAAAPLWAAVTALVNASPACAGHTIGFANPALYAVAGSGYAVNFRDITAYRPGHKPTTNRYLDTEPFPVTPGYDMATGLGTPIASELAASLCAFAPPVPPSPTTPSAEITQPPAPAATPRAPAPLATPTLSHASLTGVAKGKPRLAFTVTARPGAELRTLVVELPPALITEAPANEIRLRLRTPRPSVRFRLAYPDLRAKPQLLEHIKSGVTKRLGFVIGLRETGGKGARLPLVLPIH